MRGRRGGCCGCVVLMDSFLAVFFWVVVSSSHDVVAQATFK